MRYLGGGVGHYKVDLSVEPDIMEPEDELEVAGDDDTASDEGVDWENVDLEALDRDVSMHPDRKSGDEDQDESDKDEESDSEMGDMEMVLADADADEMDPEDGQVDLGDEDAEGYAEL